MSFVVKNLDFTFETFLKQAELTIKTMPHHPAFVKRKLYSMSTEITSDFLFDLDLKDKRVLTVGSSGDQLLTYALKGANDITIMDANPLAPFYIKLKISALKVLNRKKFLGFFDQKNEKFLDNKTFNLIKPFLDQDCIAFWEYLYSKTDFISKVDYIKLIFNFVDFSAGEKTIVPYLESDEDYNKLKNKIDNVNVTFVFADISKFADFADDEYDLIDLSNIYTYIDKSKFFEYVDDLYLHLSKNGIFKLHYGNKSLQKEFNLYGKKCKALDVKNMKSVFFIWKNDKKFYDEKHKNINL